MLGIRWWDEFEHDRHNNRIARERAASMEEQRHALLGPMLADIAEHEETILAALVDTSELSAADFNDLRGRAMAMASAFGAIHDALVNVQ